VAHAGSHGTLHCIAAPADIRPTETSGRAVPLAARSGQSARRRRARKLDIVSQNNVS